jgi:hypothetical protein
MGGKKLFHCMLPVCWHCLAVLNRTRFSASPTTDPVEYGALSLEERAIAELLHEMSIRGYSFVAFYRKRRDGAAVGNRSCTRVQS